MHSILSKYNTLKIKKPNSKLPKCYDAPLDLSNSPTTLTFLGITQPIPNKLKGKLHKSLSTSQ
jgi:hypothetical protein